MKFEFKSLTALLVLGVCSILQGNQSVLRAARPQSTVHLESGLPPAAAAEHMTTLPGFQLRLAAGEPQIHQPIGFTIDERGRLWVAEAYTYPTRAPEGAGLDKIVILEDTNQDGTLDSRTVFAENLNLVSGIEVGFGGVWVGAAPYLMFIPDRDGDDVPDGEPEILLDGFGFQDTHETLNSFIWGPDGWLYGCHGVFTHSAVGRPGTPDVDRIPLNAAVWRYHPSRHEFEVFAHGTSNPWGVDFNDNGQAFITACVIPHLWHVIQGGIYQRQGGQHFNPYVYDDLKTIADHQHYVGAIGEHAWWGHENPPAATTLAAGGGHAHCGAMIYLGDNWPLEFRGQIFMNNIHGNRVNQDLLERRGSGFVGHHGADLLLANDKWYRGINLKYGPNGSVYLIDWYDKNACHRVTPEIWDRSNGRIYNLAFGSPPNAKVDLRKATDEELVELQQHPNDWYVRMARRMLQERSSVGRLTSETVKSLIDQFHNQTDVGRQLRAIWALHCINGMTEDFRSELLSNSNEYVRSWAIQLELENGQVTDSFFNRMVELAVSDESPVVRLYLAAAAQRLPKSKRWRLVEALADHAEDREDQNLPQMYWYAIEPLVSADLSRAMALATSTKIPMLTRFIVRRAAMSKDGLQAVVSALESFADGDRQLLYLTELLESFKGRANVTAPPAWPSAYRQILASDNEMLIEMADQVAVGFGDARVYPKLQRMLADKNAPAEKRKQALEVLVRSRDEKSAASFQAVLTEPNLRGPALRALSRLADVQTPAVVLAHYTEFAAEEKRDAIATLVSRPEYAIQLLDAIQRGQIPGTDLHAYHIRQLLQFNHEPLNQRINEVWGAVREAPADAQAAIADYKLKLSTDVLAAADVHNGRRIYDATCASCHSLFGNGGAVGPDITGSNRADLNYVLENILAPSAVLAKEYRMTFVLTRDGRLVSGILQNETESAITLRTINDMVVIPRDDIEERRLSDLSIMPAGQLDSLQPNEVRDLIAYLAVPNQVSPRGPNAPIDATTNRVADAIEGESIKLIRPSEGKIEFQSMTSFRADQWSDGKQLWWHTAKPGATLELEIRVPADGIFDLELVMTQASDYGIVQLLLDGEQLGGPIDLFNSPDVITTGVLSFPGQQLAQGMSQLRIEIVGANPQAIKSYLFGLDYLRLVPSATK